MWIDLDKLQINRPALHRLVAKQVGYVTGIRVVDLEGYSPEVARGIQEWAKTGDIAAAAVTPSEPQVDFENTLKEQQADIQRRADEAAARNRLIQYATEQGLEDTQRNAEHIKQWLADNVKGYASEQGIDLAIQCLGRRGKNVLKWRAKEAPAPPPPQEPVEVLGTLPDGTKQLPLDVDQFTLRRASKDQARDWLKRTNAGKIIRPSGSFRSSIF